MHQLGMPLYLDDQQVNRPLTLSHDPAAPGSPVHLFYGNGRVPQVVQGPLTLRHGTSGLGRISPLAGALGAVLAPQATSVTMTPGTNTVNAKTAGTVTSMTVPVDNGNTRALGGVAIVGGALLYVGLYGLAGWYAGKAMAPSASAQGSYKWVGALTSVLFGSLGLGVMGGIALSQKR